MCSEGAKKIKQKYEQAEMHSGPKALDIQGLEGKSDHVQYALELMTDSLVIVHRTCSAYQYDAR